MFGNLFGDKNERALKPLRAIVSKIGSFEDDFSKLTEEELKSKTLEFKNRLGKGESLSEILPEAYAVVREVSKRELGERHFDSQLLGGILLHNRAIAEMRTGEGKTLVATLPVYLNALTGKGVHVVTVNDYLSRRDAVWMGQIYSYLGLSVGVINHDASYLYDPNHQDKDKKRDILGSYKIIHDFLKPCSRREAYEADITYGTNNEFGFDYLRDNIEYDLNNLRQRGFHFAIVDEIDSILIDEARTPLIISAPSSDSEKIYQTFAQIVKLFRKDEDYTVDEKYKAIQINDSGIEKAEKSLGIGNIYTDASVKYVHHLECAVKAKALYTLDKDYVIKDGKIVIVDEFTGRLQPGRRWSEGLHQAIEAKEGVVVEKESRTFASVTFQNYFRLYEKLSGMTGTASTSAEEFYKVYGLDVVSIPTNKPIRRKDHNDLIFQTENGKFLALAKRVKELQQKGQPVLIGTVSIERNEILSEYLKREGVKHEILNAKNHEREAEIIALAGKKGSVTIATNMAGRGVDIKLGGPGATLNEKQEVIDLGGLFVVGTERHEARRIDNQLRGRAGRQGDPGETQFYVSLEDDLMRIFASETLKKILGKWNIPEDEPIEHGMLNKSLESAQTKIEGLNFDARKRVLEYDDILNYQRKIIYERRNKVLLGKIEDLRKFFEEFLREAPADLKLKIEEKVKQYGEDKIAVAYRFLTLQATDMFFMDHLEMMDYLRSSVNLRAYGQRDPLIEYKKEALKLFRHMEESIRSQIYEMLTKIQINEGQKEIPKPEIRPKKEFENIGRNDLCPCGSGKKYKKCHGK